MGEGVDRDAAAFAAARATPLVARGRTIIADTSVYV